jgi:hypothetical protein
MRLRGFVILRATKTPARAAAALAASAATSSE